MVARQQVSFLGGCGSEQFTIVDGFVEMGIEPQYAQVAGELAQVIVADELHS